MCVCGLHPAQSPRIGVAADDHDLEIGWGTENDFAFGLYAGGRPGGVGLPVLPASRRPSPIRRMAPQQGYPAAYRPVPSAAIPDDDDDIPANQLAHARAYPPPPLSRGRLCGARSPAASRLPAPPLLGNRQPPACRLWRPQWAITRRRRLMADRPVGNGQPESYGAAARLRPAQSRQRGLPQQPYGQQRYTSRATQPQYGASSPNQVRCSLDRAQPGMGGRAAAARATHRHGAAEHGRDACRPKISPRRQGRACRRSSSASS